MWMARNAYSKTLKALPAILNAMANFIQTIRKPPIRARTRTSQVGVVGEKVVRNQVSPRPPVGN